MANEKHKIIARNRIEYLFNLINKTDDFDLGAINAIEKIRLKYNIRLNKKQKTIYCKYCLNKYKDSKVRFRKIKKSGIKFLQKIIICKHCNMTRKFCV